MICTSSIKSSFSDVNARALDTRVRAMSSELMMMPPDLALPLLYAFEKDSFPNPFGGLIGGARNLWRRGAMGVAEKAALWEGRGLSRAHSRALKGRTRLMRRASSLDDEIKGLQGRVDAYMQAPNIRSATVPETARRRGMDAGIRIDQRRLDKLRAKQRDLDRKVGQSKARFLEAGTRYDQYLRNVPVKTPAEMWPNGTPIGTRETSKGIEYLVDTSRRRGAPLDTVTIPRLPETANGTVVVPSHPVGGAATPATGNAHTPARPQNTPPSTQGGPPSTQSTPSTPPSTQSTPASAPGGSVQGGVDAAAQPVDVRFRQWWSGLTPEQQLRYSLGGGAAVGAGAMYMMNG